MFVLVADVLSTMFSNALSSGVLYGISLGALGKICHLQYGDDLIILTAEGAEDLRIIKLILYLFEGISSLAINFHKTSIYSTRIGLQSDSSLSGTLNCSTRSLPLTYLGIPISGKCPNLQDRETLISKIRSRLATWKSRMLSIGGRLTLVNPFFYLQYTVD